MAGKTRVIDAATKDYVRDDRGGYVYTATIRTKIYHQLMTPLGSWWGDPPAGSDVHLAHQMGTGTPGVVFLKNAVRTALQGLVDEGMARDLRVEATGTATGRLILESRITDIQAGELDVSGLVSF